MPFHLKKKREGRKNIKTKRLEEMKRSKKKRCRDVESSIEIALRFCLRSGGSGR
jgi:hypothetical protein